MPGTMPGTRWGDDVDDAADDVPSTRIEPDGTKVVVDIRTNDEGKRIKVTTRVRSTVVKTTVNPAVARRKRLNKFGESRGLPSGIDTNSTSYGEKQIVKFVAGKSLDGSGGSGGAGGDGGGGGPSSGGPASRIPAAAGGGAKIICRICKGDHWTTKCPFKDSHMPADAEPSKMDEPLSIPGLSSGGAGKYIPPSQRAGATGTGTLPPGARGSGPRDDLSTIRITNLSEEVTEQDVKDLVSKFGHTSRVFVARDRDTNMCKGFAFVSFYGKDDAERAMAQLNGYGYDNLILHVEFAKNKEREP